MFLRRNDNVSDGFENLSLSSYWLCETTLCGQVVLEILLHRKRNLAKASIFYFNCLANKNLMISSVMTYT